MTKRLSLAGVIYEELELLDLLLVPGGRGTRREVDNPAMLAWLQHEAETASLVTSVCTGSALLARAGVLGEAEAEQVAT